MCINNKFRFCSLCILNYYPQTFLEDCKSMRKNRKTKNCIDTELESESESDSGMELELESSGDSDIDNEE